MTIVNHKNFLRLALIACTFIIGACAHQPDRQTQTADLIDAALAEGVTAPLPGKAVEKPPESVTSALLPSINLDLPGSSGIDVEPRFDIKVNRANARQFFMGLVEDTPYNLVMHPKVKGNITLDLKNVTVKEVMEVVRTVYGYEYELNKTGFQVFPNVMATRIFKVNYLDITRSGESQMRVSSGQVTQVQSQGINNNTNSTSRPSRQSLPGSRISTTSKSNFWEELQQALVVIVGSREGSSVVVSPQSGIVVVRAMPGELRTVEKFLSTTQNIIQRQVIIEAKILEVELSDGFQSGINWAALNAGSTRALAGQVGGGSIFSGSGTTSLSGNTGLLDPSDLSQVVGTATSAFGGVFTLALNIGNDFSAFIELLKTQGNVQVLSSPQISTLNNQKAVIKVGTDEFFVTDVDTSTNTSSSTSTTQNNVELTPFFSGVALDVIPQISEEGDIILHVHPTVSTVTEEVKNISVSSTSTLSIPLAVSSIRESDSIIRAKDGQVVVIGGLMQNSVSEEVASVPLLGDLPLIGGLFRHTKKVNIKSELVILLRPIIVKNGQQWSHSIQRSRDRMRHMQAIK